MTRVGDVIMLDNPEPIIYDISGTSKIDVDLSQPITQETIFALIKDINDPEHPLTLEQLNVVNIKDIQVTKDHICVYFTPTIPHCSMATLIGLCIKIQLKKKLHESRPYYYNIDVLIKEGSHVTEEAINKQLNDKERIMAAMENDNLQKVVEMCLNGPLQSGIATS